MFVLTVRTSCLNPSPGSGAAAQMSLLYSNVHGGGGGRVLGVRTPPPPPFWGTPKLHKEGKDVGRKRRVLVLNSYPDPPPPFPKSCIRPCRNTFYFHTLVFPQYKETSRRTDIHISQLFQHTGTSKATGYTQSHRRPAVDKKSRLYRFCGPYFR